jgi:Flp pilus assembly protein TadD
MKIMWPTLFAVVLGMGAGSAWGQGQGAPRRLQDVESISPQSRRLTEDAAAAEIRGDPNSALNLANQAATVDDANPWAHYDRGAALSQMRKTDDAVQAFRQAEERFSSRNRWGHSIAIYGRAHALDQARRCNEARSAYLENADFVQSYDQRSADMARRYAAACGTAPVAAPAPAPAPKPQQ